MQSLQQFIVSLSEFINGVLIPFLFALALLFFIYHTAKYFILEGGEPKEEAKTMALYGIAAFVVLVSIWGIVNLLMNGLGLRQNNPVTPDYFETSRSGGSESFFQFGGGTNYDPYLTEPPVARGQVGTAGSQGADNVRKNNFWDSTFAP